MIGFFQVNYVILNLKEVLVNGMLCFLRVLLCLMFGIVTLCHFLFGILTIDDEQPISIVR